MSLTSTRRNMLRRLFPILMVTKLAVAHFESAGARRAAEAATAVAVAAAAARAASTVARMVTCPETAPSLRKVVEVEEAETASTAASLVICPEIARNPRNPESLVAVVVAAVAAVVSTVVKPDTCLVSALSRESQENQGVLEADQLVEMTIEFASTSEDDVARFLLPKI